MMISAASLGNMDMEPVSNFKFISSFNYLLSFVLLRKRDPFNRVVIFVMQNNACAKQFP